MNQLVNLLYKPLDDESIINALESQGLAIPELDDNYALKGTVDTGKSRFGIEFIFSGKDNEASNGSEMPVLVNISIYKDYQEDLISDVKWSDSYVSIREKIGVEPRYGDQYIDEMKIWRLPRHDDKEILVCFDFSDDMSEIRTFVLAAVTPGTMLGTIPLSENN